MRMRRAAEVVRRSADKVVLVAAMGTWWFVLRWRAGVVDAVDAMSYLVSVYSLWRGVRSFVRTRRPADLLFRRPEDGREGATGEEDDDEEAIMVRSCGRPPPRRTGQ